MSILSTNTRLIKVGQDYSAGSGISIDDSVISVTGEFGKTYSAGDNISIYEQGEQLYISSKDWTNDIANASSNAYSEAVSQIPDPFDPSFISGQVDNKLDTTAFTNWQNGQYSTDLQTIEGQISNKLDESAFGQVSGSFLTAINIPESAVWQDVSTTVQSNSAQWAEGGAGDEEVNSIVQSNSANWNEVSAKVDTTALNSIVDSSTISYNAKPTNNPIYASGNDLNNVDSIQGRSNLAIIPSNVLQVPNVITAAPNAVLQVKDVITAATNGVLQVPNVITAVPNVVLEVPNLITVNAGGVIANGLTAQKYYGLTANGITANSIMSGFSANGITAGKRGPLCIQGNSESISSVNGAGFTFSSQNTNFGTAQLTTANSNQFVKIPSPKFEARNISGAGFCIEASGAKGYDESGNVVWDTYTPQVKNIISYGDTKTSVGGLSGNIILTVMPSTTQSNISSSPYVIMDASNASYFASYGPSAQTPTVRLAPDTITFSLPVGNSGRTTVGCYDIKQEFNGSSWTLTGSVQKREIEYDADTSAITAIAGSAIGGETLTGDAQGAVDTVYSTSGNIITGTKSEHNFTARNVNKITFGNITINGLRDHIKNEHDGYPNDNWLISDQGFYLGPEFFDGYFENYSRVWLERTGLSSMSGTKSDKKLIWRALLDNDVEGANNTITAIAGSAIGGGVTGEFVPQSAFDELKQSYDALSSLFATYSGQWLLPNEGV